MEEKHPTIQDANDSLLSSEERVACQAIAAKQSGLASQRAAGLMALAGGTTQLEAARLSDLTIGQIRYLLTIFRRKGMAIFPVENESTSSLQVAVGQPETKISAESAVGGKSIQAAKKEKMKAAPKKEKEKKNGGIKGRKKKAKDKKVKEKTKKKKKDKAKKAK